MKNKWLNLKVHIHKKKRYTDRYTQQVTHTHTQHTQHTTHKLHIHKTSYTFTYKTSYTYTHNTITSYIYTHNKLHTYSHKLHIHTPNKLHIQNKLHIHIHKYTLNEYTLNNRADKYLRNWSIKSSFWKIISEDIPVKYKHYSQFFYNSNVFRVCLIDMFCLN